MTAVNYDDAGTTYDDPLVTYNGASSKTAPSNPLSELASSRGGYTVPPQWAGREHADMPPSLTPRELRELELRPVRRRVAEVVAIMVLEE